MPGTEESVRIAMADGVALAATLYLPESDRPQPCLLEALPYRKDDLTSSYAEGYRSLRDDHEYAVCRVDLRGTGSSGGEATDEYPAVERSDLCAVIAWLADQDWCDGNVGMFGTSYSGFNSLQVACERPPALKAICAIYASDDRWSDDVHWRGHALKLLDLVDYCHYMTAMNLLPPVPAEWGGTDWREEWHRRLDTQEPWVLTWLREHRDGPYWRAGSVRQGDGLGLRAHRVPRDDRGRAGRTATATTPSGPSRRCARPAYRIGCSPGRGRTRTPRPRSPARGSTSTGRWSRGGTGGCAAPRPSTEDRLDVFVRTSTRPEPDLDMHEGYWASLEHANVAPGDPEADISTTSDIRMFDGPRTLAVEPDVGTAAWIDCAGHLPWGLSGDQREDDARSLTWDFEPPSDGDRGPTPGEAEA